MKRSKFTDSQILAILKEAQSGVRVPDLCRNHGMSDATFYKWRAKFGGMDASMMKRMKVFRLCITKTYNMKPSQSSA
jgi:putative transposase